MKNFKNNFRRNRYRNNGDRSFHKNGSDQKLNSDFSNNSNFKRRNPGRNNQNASKLVEKYTSLAREALSNGDKILSTNIIISKILFILSEFKSISGLNTSELSM